MDWRSFEFVSGGRRRNESCLAKFFNSRAGNDSNEGKRGL